MKNNQSAQAGKKRRGPPPKRFKSINIGINDAYGSLRQYINESCNSIPNNHLSSTRDIYSLSFIYEIIKDFLPQEVIRIEVGDKLPHQANELQALLPRLVQEALNHGNISTDTIIDEILNFAKFRDFSMSLKRRAIR